MQRAGAAVRHVCAWVFVRACVVGVLHIQALFLPFDNQHTRPCLFFTLEKPSSEVKRCKDVTRRHFQPLTDGYDGKFPIMYLDANLLGFSVERLVL